MSHGNHSGMDDLPGYNEQPIDDYGTAAAESDGGLYGDAVGQPSQQQYMPEPPVTHAQAPTDNQNAPKKKKILLAIGATAFVLALGGVGFAVMSGHSTSDSQGLPAPAPVEQMPNMTQPTMAPEPAASAPTEAQPGMMQPGMMQPASAPDSTSAASAPANLAPTPAVQDAVNYVTRDEFKAAFIELSNQIARQAPAASQGAALASGVTAPAKKRLKRKEVKAEVEPVKAQEPAQKFKPEVRGIISGMAWIEHEGKLSVIHHGDVLPDGSIVQNIDSSTGLITTNRGGFQ